LSLEWILTPTAGRRRLGLLYDFLPNQLLFYFVRILMLTYVFLRCTSLCYFFAVYSSLRPSIWFIFRDITYLTGDST